MAALKPHAQTPGPWGSLETCPHQTEQAPLATAQPGAPCDPGAQASQDQAGNQSQDPHGNAPHPPIPNPPSLLLRAKMAAPKSRSLQWFGAQQVARQPGPPPPRALHLEAELAGDTGTPLHPAVQIRLWSSFTTQHLRSPPSAGAGCRSEPGAEPRWQPSTAQPGCDSRPILLEILGGAGKHIQAHTPSTAKRRRAALSQR